MKKQQLMKEIWQDIYAAQFTDEELKAKWDEWENLDTDGAYLTKNWFIFPAGTDNMEIVSWFAAKYSKGIKGLESR